MITIEELDDMDALLSNRSHGGQVEIILNEELNKRYQDFVPRAIEEIRRLREALKWTKGILDTYIEAEKNGPK